jgi:hypothetical protein
MLLSAIGGYTQILTSRLKAERINEKRDRGRGAGGGKNCLHYL